MSSRARAVRRTRRRGRTTARGATWRAPNPKPTVAGRRLGCHPGLEPSRRAPASSHRRAREPGSESGAEGTRTSTASPRRSSSARTGRRTRSGRRWKRLWRRGVGIARGGPSAGERHARHRAGAASDQFRRRFHAALEVRRDRGTSGEPRRPRRRALDRACSTPESANRIPTCGSQRLALRPVFPARDDETPLGTRHADLRRPSPAASGTHPQPGEQSSARSRGRGRGAPRPGLASRQPDRRRRGGGGRRARARGEFGSDRGSGGKSPQSPSPHDRAPMNPSRSSDLVCDAATGRIGSGGGSGDGARHAGGGGGGRRSNSFTSTPGPKHAPAGSVMLTESHPTHTAGGAFIDEDARALAMEYERLREDRDANRREHELLRTEFEHAKSQTALLRESNRNYEARVEQLERLVRECNAQTSSLRSQLAELTARTGGPGGSRGGALWVPPRPSPSQLASRAGREIQTRRGRRRGCRRPGSTSRSTTRRRRGRGRTATGAVTPEVSRGSEAVSCREPPRRRRRGAPLRVRSRRFRRIRARVSLTAWATFTRARGEVGTRRRARRRTGRDGMRRRLWRW